jgi:periplasmic divalent cation tolerance protein
MTDLILILTTMPDDDRAAALARTLVEERLAACVNVYPAMISTYRWQGQIEAAPERQVIIKTTAACLDAVTARLRAVHPYELPELVVLDARAGEAYGEWITNATVAGGR